MCFLRKLLTGNTKDVSVFERNAYKQQVLYLRQIWDEQSYGIERLFRISLCLGLFFFPTTLVQTLFSRSRLMRKLAVEAYMVLKLFLPLVMLTAGLYQSVVARGIVIYLLSETIFNILGVVFFSETRSVEISYWRSVLFLCLHYLEVVFDFAVIYAGADLLNKAVSPLTALYFSFVTNTTLGYGDYHPVQPLGYCAVICQLLIFALFIILFINYFSSRTGGR